MAIRNSTYPSTAINALALPPYRYEKIFYRTGTFHRDFNATPLKTLLAKPTFRAAHIAATARALIVPVKSFYAITVHGNSTFQSVTFVLCKKSKKQSSTTASIHSLQVECGNGHSPINGSILASPEIFLSKCAALFCCSRTGSMTL